MRNEPSAPTVALGNPCGQTSDFTAASTGWRITMTCFAGLPSKYNSPATGNSGLRGVVSALPPQPNIAVSRRIPQQASQALPMRTLANMRKTRVSKAIDQRSTVAQIRLPRGVRGWSPQLVLIQVVG